MGDEIKPTSSAQLFQPEMSSTQLLQPDFFSPTFTNSTPIPDETQPPLAHGQKVYLSLARHDQSVLKHTAPPVVE